MVALGVKQYSSSPEATELLENAQSMLSKPLVMEKF